MATFATRWHGLGREICDNRRVSDFEVTDNPDRRRYELRVNDQIVSIADYQLSPGGVVIVPYVETDPENRGNGMADRLMRGMLDDLRAHHRKLTPICPFAVAYVRRHPADHDLLA